MVVLYYKCIVSIIYVHSDGSEKEVHRESKHT